MSPPANSLWRYVGPGNGYHDIQRILAVLGEDVVTVSEVVNPLNIRWSWFGPYTEFRNLFQPFSNVLARSAKRFET